MYEVFVEESIHLFILKHKYFQQVWYMIKTDDLVALFAHSKQKKSAMETRALRCLKGLTVIISTYLQVLSKESLEESTLPAASGPQDVAAEDAALGLFLLQINAFVPCY